jgi:hypothetical protein
MTRSARLLYSTLRSALRIGALVIAFSSAAWAQSGLPPDAQRHLDTIAAALQVQPSRTASLLQQFGLPTPESASDNWRDFYKWSAQRQLEFAYRAAEEAQTGNGKVLLDRMAVQTAAVNAAIRSEPRFAGILPGPGVAFEVPPIEPMPFKPPQGAVATEALDANVRELVDLISRHIEASPHGHFYFMARCCGLNEAASGKVMQETSALSEALKRAILEGRVPPELLERLARLSADAAKANLALAFAEEFRPYQRALLDFAMLPDERQGKRGADIAVAPAVDARVAEFQPALRREIARLSENKSEFMLAMRNGFDDGKMAPDLPPRDPILPMGGPGAAAKPDYGNFRERWFEFESYGRTHSAGESTSSPGGGGGGGGGGQHSFKRVVRFAGGKGGIIFGSEVTAAADVPLPLSVVWRPLDGSSLPTGSLAADTVGVFVFKFADGTTSISPPNVAEDALGAVRIAFTGVSGATVPAQGEDGIGLVGYLGRSERYSLSGDQVTQHTDLAMNFAVNPAISTLGMAKVVMMGDAYPWIPELSSRLIEASKKANVDPVLLHLLDEWAAFEKGQYKITDVPLEVYRSDSKRALGVRRVDDVGATYSDVFASRYFIDMQMFDGATPLDRDSVPSFYTLLPIVTQVSSDYYRLNEFARTVALLRWAAGAGAMWSGELVVAEAPLSFGSVTLTNDKLWLGPAQAEELFQLGENAAQLGAEMLKADDAGSDLLALNNKVTRYRQDVAAFLGILQMAKGSMETFYLPEEQRQAFGDLSVAARYDQDATAAAALEALLEPITAKVDADWEVIAKRAAELEDQNPLLTAGVRVAFTDSTTRDRYLELGSQRSELRDIIASGEFELEALTSYDRDPSLHPFVHWLLASQATQAATVDLIQRWVVASESDRGLEADLREVLLSKLARPTMSAIKARELGARRDLASAQRQLRITENSMFAPSLFAPGGLRWMRLQESFPSISSLLRG